MLSSSIKDYIDLEGNYFCTDSLTKFGNNDENGETCKDNKGNNTYINKKERKRKSKIQNEEKLGIRNIVNWDCCFLWRKKFEVLSTFKN
ncbi:hypothetical protein YYC_05416 [Plasmodium yoelii 17X]|nr:hypothetical protein YYC_05416 [Plasmodium yoelii 17X]